MGQPEQIECYSVYWVDLNPTRGSEINKIRPCVIVSPNELNKYLNTVIIIPLTTAIHNYPWRVLCKIDGKEGAIATDQIKTVDKSRIGKYIGSLNNTEKQALKML